MAFGAMAVPAQLERYTAQTITGAGALEAELAAVRRDGYAAAVAELEESWSRWPRRSSTAPEPAWPHCRCPVLPTG